MLIKDIKYHLYTQLRVNLILNKEIEENDKYKIEFKFNNVMMEKIFEDLKNNPNYEIEPVSLVFNKGLISFEGNKSDFDSRKDFNKFLTEKIKTEELSLINFDKTSRFKNWIQEKTLTLDVKYYKLDMLYDIFSRTTPIIKENGNEVEIDGGKNYLYKLDKSHFVVDLIKEAIQLENKIDVDQELKIKNSNKFKI